MSKLNFEFKHASGSRSSTHQLIELFNNPEPKCNRMESTDLGRGDLDVFHRLEVASLYEEVEEVGCRLQLNVLYSRSQLFDLVSFYR